MTSIQTPTAAQPFYSQLFDADFMRKLERLSLISRKLKQGRLKGERRSPKRGQSVEFADYRNYAPGDDLRRLDWNAYARMERLFVKLYQEEEDLTVHVLLDASKSMDWGDPNAITLTAPVAPVDAESRDRGSGIGDRPSIRPDPHTRERVPAIPDPRKDTAGQNKLVYAKR